MATLDSILNFLIPLLLMLIAFGFVYTKFLKPWVVPHLIKLWEYSQGTHQNNNIAREITYE